MKYIFPTHRLYYNKTNKRDYISFLTSSGRRSEHSRFSFGLWAALIPSHYMSARCLLLLMSACQHFFLVWFVQCACDPLLFPIYYDEVCGSAVQRCIEIRLIQLYSLAKPFCDCCGLPFESETGDRGRRSSPSYFFGIISLRGFFLNACVAQTCVFVSWWSHSGRCDTFFFRLL